MEGVSGEGMKGEVRERRRRRGTRAGHLGTNAFFLSAVGGGRGV